MHSVQAYDVYLAGPFFNDAQKATMDQAKLILLEAGLKVLDPRDLNGIIVDNSELRKADRLAKIFEDNVRGMENSWSIFACIDDRDTGTAWELGYFYHLNRHVQRHPIVTFSSRGYGCNVMLAQAANTHFPTLHDLEEEGNEYRLYDAVLQRNYSDFMTKVGMMHSTRTLNTEKAEATE